MDLWAQSRPFWSMSIGDTRRILDLRTSGEAAEWCGAHIASTRRRMDRASTVAPSSRASTVETIETDETN